MPEGLLEIGRDVFLTQAVSMAFTPAPDHVPHAFLLGGAVKQVRLIRMAEGELPRKISTFWLVALITACPFQLLQAPGGSLNVVQTSRSTRKGIEATQAKLDVEFQSFLRSGTPDTKHGEREDCFHPGCFLEFGSFF